jgi:hypothetical protein
MQARAAGVVHQIVSVGAGFDTTFFRLHARGLAPTRYVEVDFPALLARKAACMLGDPAMMAAVGDLTQEYAAVSVPPAKEGADPPPPPAPVRELRSQHYVMVGADLTDLATAAARLSAAGVAPVRGLLLFFF